MPAAMPCKTLLCRSSRETCRTTGGHKTKYIYENPNGRMERAAEMFGDVGKVSKYDAGSASIE